VSDLIIKNDCLEVCITTKGAQIKSVKSDKEYMWEANPEIWGKSAPVLFPICGTLKDGKYTYKGVEYSMQSHGFAPKMDYSVREHKQDRLSLYITDNEETIKSYPFNFDFEVKFTLNGTSLKVEYNVTNKGADKLYYSVGCHEAYACPEGIEEYYLEFDKKLDLEEYTLEGPFMSGKTAPFANEMVK
jgi:galactose mutarotase-like enzyme